MFVVLARLWWQPVTTATGGRCRWRYGREHRNDRLQLRRRQGRQVRHAADVACDRALHPRQRRATLGRAGERAVAARAVIPYSVAPSVTGGGGGGGLTVASTETIACSCVDDRVDRYAMPPTLPAIAFCTRVSVAPPLVELASAPWQLAQLFAYSVAPSVTGGGGGGGLTVREHRNDGLQLGRRQARQVRHAADVARDRALHPRQRRAGLGRTGERPVARGAVVRVECRAVRRPASRG